MVEIEIGVLAAQCLDRRIESYTRLVAETAAWEKRRNADHSRINWMFTTEKARAKMARTYPKPAARFDRKESKPLCRGTSRGVSLRWLSIVKRGCRAMSEVGRKAEI